MLALFKTLFERDLNRMKEELMQYKEHMLLWSTDGEINNSAGNICLHVCGNLLHYIGTIIGKTGFKRDRESEFTIKNLPLSDLVERIDQTIEAVNTTLDAMEEADLEKPYPLHFLGTQTTQFYFMHLYGHLSYHRGQINYHRRLIS
ncbi:MAG: DUF1572 family protein [Bacteroidota bacterium]